MSFIMRHSDGREAQPDLFVVSNKVLAERKPFAHILDID